MQRRIVGLVAPLAITACGAAFTSGTDDDGGGRGPDSSLDASTGIGVDGTFDDVRVPREAAARDVVADEHGPDEGGDAASSSVVDGGAIEAGSACTRTCPSGFDCVAGLCEDRAAVHFSSASTISNWSYGSFGQYGSTAFKPYTETWTAGNLAFSSQTKDTLELSVFYCALATSYQGMAIPAGALGLYPGPTTQDSVVRWTAPAAGHYRIDATFTGLGTMPQTMVGADVNVGQSVVFGQTINAAGGPNTITYSNADQTLAKDGTIDFYVFFITTPDDLQGGTRLEARILAL